jgi:hypothetical protein
MVAKTEALPRDLVGNRPHVELRKAVPWITTVIHEELRRFHQMNHGCGVGLGWHALGLMAKPVVGLWLWAR